ncbi:MAG: DUF6175 family protein [Sideroxydans sp.]|nr:DUF6175 family protein [Sideroxydans sp.]
MRHILLGCVVSLAFIFSSCASTVPPVQSSAPQSFEAQFIEASSASEVLIRATGKANNVGDAIADAKKVAVWYVLFGGESPLVGTADKAKFDGIAAGFWGDCAKWVRYTSDIKGKRQEGSQTLVDVVVKVDREGMRQSLVSAGVLPDSAQVNEALNLPSIIIQSNSEVLSMTVASALRKSDFNLLSEEAQTKQHGILSQLAALEGIADPAYEAAMASGADVYVKAQVNIESGNVAGIKTQKASVALSSYDTATTQLLASATGYSAERRADPSALTEEAAQDASLQLRSALTQAWGKALKDGKIFKVFIKSEEPLSEDQEDAFVDALKALKQPKIKRQASGSNIISYWVWSKSYADAYELYSALKGEYGGPGKLSKTMESGRLLVVNIKDEAASPSAGMSVQ